MTDTVSETDRRDIAASLNGEGEAYARLVQRYQIDIAAQMRRIRAAAYAQSMSAECGKV